MRAELALVFSASWARPAALWALVVPLLFLLCLRLFARAPEHVTGTLELWKELAPTRARGANARGKIPPWGWITALGLFFAALAWAGPRGPRAIPPQVWSCVVDRSLSMGLAARAGEAEARLECALRAAEDWLAEHAERRARVRWIAAGRAPLELPRGVRPSDAWLELEPDAEPEWVLRDQPGTLWVTDRAPDVARRHAGLFASGGPEVAGPIAADGNETVSWEAGKLVTASVPRALAVRVREPAGRALPEVVERVLGAWCAARGFELVRAPRDGTLLIVELLAADARDEAGPEFECARDGWRARGRAVTSSAFPREGGDAAGAEEWLAAQRPDGTRLDLVHARSGRIELNLRELSEPEGDPVLFALSWARLLDRCTRPVPGVLPLEERLAAGDALLVPGEAPAPSVELGADLGPSLDAGLALAAALCAMLVLLGFARR